MKKTVYYLLGLVMLVAVCASCKRKVVKGEGNMQTEQRNVSAFNAIDIDMPLKAKIHIVNTTNAPVLQIKAQKNLLDGVKTEVKNGVLRLYTDKLFHFSTDEDMIAEINMPQLLALTISGAGDADIDGNLAGESFELKVTGAGDVEIQNINTNKFTAKLSGAGNVTVKSGLVNQVDMRITGMGDINAYGLQGRAVAAAITGAGDIDITALEALNASITGAGDITYKGKPTVSSSITGPGSVEAAD
jgi:hypothetical protein